MQRFLVTLLFSCFCIVSFGQKTFPYNIHQRPLPVGEHFEKLLPKKVGLFSRITIKEPAPGFDGEAVYQNGKDEVFMLFSLSADRKDQKETMQTIFTETKENAIGEQRQTSLKTDPMYIHLIGKGIAFFAWTRGLYCFSADSKGGDPTALKIFMEKFPY
ncbi:MAG TPA: hypothetical protein VM935_10340 [Chitinophagaceae bacterium]|nr:hypothetical protein [Chitinophagaceae bacterium]